MQSNGVKVFVEPMALFNVVGTVMDWEETELSSEFTFKNPNSKGECGCGKFEWKDQMTKVTKATQCFSRSSSHNCILLWKKGESFTV